MARVFFNFFRWILTMVKPAPNHLHRENLSSLPEPVLDLNLLPDNFTSPVQPNFDHFSLTAYRFDSEHHKLEKVNISFYSDLVDIITITPWNLIGLNSQYQLVSLNLLPPGFYLMNTPDFPCSLRKNEQVISFEPTSVPDGKIVDLPVITNIEVLKQKNISYPIFTPQYLDYNKAHFSQEEILKLFNSIYSQPINSLNDSLDIFETKLNQKTRLFGHRWSLNSQVYYSESKLSALDQCSLSAPCWQDQPVQWLVGHVGIIQYNNTNLLIEVIAVEANALWVVDRQQAINLLKNGETKESALLKAQSQIKLSNIKKTFLIKN